MFLDLCYEEDCNAEADFNIAMTDTGEFVEVQGTGENKPFSRGSLDEMLRLAQKGIKELFLVQQQAISSIKKM
jgi:ribonuclease PH